MPETSGRASEVSRWAAGGPPCVHVIPGSGLAPFAADLHQHGPPLQNARLLPPPCLGCGVWPHPCSPLAGPPVNVALAIEVASIDHISEVNMVGAARLCPTRGRAPRGAERLTAEGGPCPHRSTP